MWGASKPGAAVSLSSCISKLFLHDLYIFYSLLAILFCLQLSLIGSIYTWVFFILCTIQLVKWHLVWLVRKKKMKRVRYYPGLYYKFQFNNSLIFSKLSVQLFQHKTFLAANIFKENWLFTNVRWCSWKCQGKQFLVFGLKKKKNH